MNANDASDTKKKLAFLGINYREQVVAQADPLPSATVPEFDAALASVDKLLLAAAKQPERHRFSLLDKIVAHVDQTAAAMRKRNAEPAYRDRLGVIANRVAELRKPDPVPSSVQPPVIPDPVLPPNPTIPIPDGPGMPIPQGMPARGGPGGPGGPGRPGGPGGPGGLGGPGALPVRRAAVPITRKILNEAAVHEEAKKAPTGAWNAQSIPDGQGGTKTAELTRDGQAAIVGKKQVAMTAEKMSAANSALEASGSKFRFASTGSAVKIGDQDLSTLKAEFVLALDGPDRDLADRRARGESVTYADCHRNAVVSVGFEFDPTSGRDCEKPSVPPTALAPDEIQPAKKINQLKAVSGMVDMSSKPELAKMMANAERYTGSVGERSTRSVLKAFMPKVADKHPTLKVSFDRLDAISEAYCSTALQFFNPAKIRGDREASKKEELGDDRTKEIGIARQARLDTIRAELAEQRGVPLQQILPADVNRVAADDPEMPKFLSDEEEAQLQADLLAIEEEKLVLADAKKTWNKYTLLSLVSDEFAKAQTAGPAEETAEQKLARCRAAAQAKIREVMKGKLPDSELETFVTAFPVEDSAVAYDEMCKDLQINQYCKPKPGQVMSVVSPGASDLWKEVKNPTTEAELAYRQRQHVAEQEKCRPEEVTEAMIKTHRTQFGFPNDLETWNFHWAAVVASEDGGDQYMTFENFSVEDTAAINDNQIFNAYSSEKSMFDHYKESGFFGTAAIAMCFDKNPPG